MNKVKKAITVVSAALMCALPLANAFSANAADDRFKDYGANQKHTYRTYVNLDTKHKKVYEFDYDLYFTGICENKMNFKSGKCLVGADDFRVEGLTQNRTVVRIESRALNDFDGAAASMVYETSQWNLKPEDIKSNISTAVYAFNNYGAEHVIRQYNPTVTEDFYLVGDADGNGVIKMNDAVIIEQYVSGIISDKKEEYDVDGNGTVNSYDAWLVRQFLIKTIDSFADYQA